MNGHPFHKLIVGVAIFLAGVAVGYAGLPLQNSKEIAVLRTKVEHSTTQVKELRTELHTFMREWRESMR